MDHHQHHPSGAEAPGMAPPAGASELGTADIASLRNAFACAVIGMAVIDLSGRWLDVNPAYCRTLGYSADELAALTVDDITFPDDRDAEYTQREQLLAGHVSGYQLHKRYIHRDGHLIWLSLSVTLARASDGAPLYFITQIQDVTAQKQTEDALRAAEERFRSTVEQLPAMVYTAEFEEKVSGPYISPQVEEILGFTPAEWLADPQLWLKRTHPDDRAMALAQIDNARQNGGIIEFECRSIARDGRIIWLQHRARMITDAAGRPHSVQGIAFDITARVLAEQAVRQSELRYRTLAQHFPHGAVFLLDRDLRFLIAAGQALERHGYSPERLEGKRLQEVLRPESLSLQEPLYRAALAGATQVDEYTANGQTFVTHYVPVPSPEGAIETVMAVSQDITDQKRTEALLRQEQELLAQRVADATAELRVANAELARAARLKDEFLASMSHELRTPLNAVLGFAESLREQIYGPLSDDQDHAVAAIEEGGQHLLSLINDVLDVAKIGAGKLTLTRERTSVEQVCQASVRMARSAAGSKQQLVELALDPAARFVDADARRLKQILVNLLANAVKFTPNGGRIGLTVTGDPAAHELRFTVWDTGVGIAPEDQGLLFQPFVQVAHGRAVEYGGTGLGLVLVARLTELHGGRVTLTSAPGEGSHFTVTLPWHEPSPADAHAGERAVDAEAPLAMLPADEIERGTILLADDSAINAQLITAYLSGLGYRVAVARSGTEAVQLAQELHPALILMDVQMPGLDGLEATRRIRGVPGLRDVPILMLTALAMDGDRERCLAAGATGYLSKPVRMRLLAAALTTHLGNRR